ncbi:hypothetical protein LTR56_020238 [Elasticomyces elasticus]|nr:hypothetical protein LTR56_020238 [Elasticomyces elasticus]KAK3633449.1 hypothetical protein LTR22_020125 [Elasticomyces elasticus]KAK4907431.1 hypothetical protein LTR49_023534 [Elasticomyces elasticus]KAK5747839.1 hypothetical protein LTS12_022096 [Elasticomyces elasticus]
MTVDAALELHKTIGNNVFVKTKSPILRVLSWKPIPKFETSMYEKVLMRATVPPDTEPGSVDAVANHILFRNDNRESARTVAIAGVTEYPYTGKHLFRSYDNVALKLQPNEQPNEHVVQTARRSFAQASHSDHWQASNVPLWKVARATTATVGIFKPMSIGAAQFEAGIDDHINPVTIAYDEVKMVSGRQPGVIISLGDGGSYRDGRSPPDISVLGIKLFEGEQYSGPRNGVAIHQGFLAKLEKHNSRNAETATQYFRFDPSAVTGLDDIRFGEWEGLGGADTIQEMRALVSSYVDSNADQIEACAKKLVQIRRRRQITLRWERFAHDNMYYRCPHALSPEAGSQVCQINSFERRQDLRQHAIDHHGFVWPIPCIQRERGTPAENAAQVLADWTCSKDHCEGTVLAFDSEEGLFTHLQLVHKVSQPRMMSLAGLEEWLDEGRIWLPLAEPLKRAKKKERDRSSNITP